MRTLGPTLTAVGARTLTAVGARTLTAVGRIDLAEGPWQPRHAVLRQSCCDTNLVLFAGVAAKA